ncbi:MAG: hypothetical protein AB8I08_03410 [Sandaracinaceae bacterium]
MPDSHDSSLPVLPDSLSSPSLLARRFDETHPYRTPSGRRRLLDERRQTARALEQAEQAATDRRRLRAELLHLDELLKVRSERAIDRIRLRTKCRERWDRMGPSDAELGPDTVRRCNRCQRDVFDLSKMTEGEIETLVTGAGAQPPLRLHRRSDGRVVTASCPPRDETPLLYGIGAAAGGAMLATSLFATSQLGAMDVQPSSSPSALSVATPAPTPVQAPPARASAPLPSPPEVRPTETEEVRLPPRPLVRTGDITLTGPRQWRVRRALVDRVLERTPTVMRVPWAIPHEEDGRVVGVKIYRVAHGSVFHRLGLRNGDMLISANGHSLVDPPSAFAVYGQLQRRPRRFSLRLERDGAEFVNLYRIVD